MDELNTLKVRIFDLTEVNNGMQLALNRIAEAAGFNDGSVDDLIGHVKMLKGNYDDVNSQDADAQTVDGDISQGSSGRRVGRPRKTDDQRSRRPNSLLG